EHVKLSRKLYDGFMPKLWSATITEHRSAVLDSILDATARLLHERGVTGLTMTALAAAAGVGRATLYKYVSDTGAAIDAWQQREVSQHLIELRAIAERNESATRLLELLEALARIRHHRHHGATGLDLHSESRMAPAEAELRDLFAEVIASEAAAGRARKDIAALELARYAVAAIGAASSMPDMASTRRLVRIIMQSLEGASGEPSTPGRSTHASHTHLS
ncbi:MAG: TetR/AcrR family transcriptional regulator, partial [Pseudolysinimonas sp.]